MEKEDRGINKAGKRGRRPNIPQEEGSGTKSAILQAARSLFAEKGYDGVSVSDISDAAGVNKALVFYYFGTKDNILKEVLKAGASEAVGRRVLFLQKENPFSRETIRAYYEESLAVMESRKEVIRILLTEALKHSETSNLLFDFFDSAMDDLPKKLSDLGLPVSDREKMMTCEFFFDAVALFTFVALKEEWAEHSGIHPERVRDIFLDVFDETLLSYISKLYFNK